MSACSSSKNPKEEIVKEEIPKEETPKEGSVNQTNNTEQQNLKQVELKRNIDFYLTQLEELNSDNIVAMTYPKLFTVTSQYLFKGSIYTMVNSSNLAISSFKTNISKIGNIQSFSNGNFSQIAYTSNIKIQFINPSLYNTQLSLNTLHSILAKKYGQKNIYVDKEQRSIHINKSEKLLAIKEKGSSWKFLGDNPTYRNLYPHFLPQDILNQI